MKRYITTFFAFVNISTKGYLENRANTFANLFATILSLTVTVVLINIIFSYTKEINSWSKNEVLLLIASSRILVSIFEAIFEKSISRIPEYIKLGQLDAMLTKPISTQFFVTFRLSRPQEIINAFAGVVLFVYSISQLGQSWTAVEFLLLIFNLILGLLIFYALYFSMATLAFWLIHFESLGNIYSMMTVPLGFPTNIYGKVVSFLITYILPLGLIVSVPVEIFIHKVYGLILVEIVVAVLLLIFSNWFWNSA